MLSKRLIDKFVESFSLNVGHHKKDFNRDYKDFVLAHDELSIIRYADLYKTSKVLNSDIQRVISDGVDAGLSNKALNDEASYDV